MVYYFTKQTRGVSILLLLFLCSSQGFALVTVSGKVKDKADGESIPSVAVQVAGTGRGVVTNVEGFFSIPDLEPGNIALTFSSLGYAKLTKALELEEGKDLNLSINLVPEALQMVEVNVEIDEAAQKERKYSPQVARMNVTTKELSKLPQLVESDLFRSIQALPGVLPTNDFSAELNIWGGSNDQNLILLNGIDVYKPTHMGGLFSVFNMDAVKDVTLIKGGFGAKYGRRLSAVVDISDKEGNRNEFHGKAGVSFLASHATLEGPLPHGSWLVAGRRTYLDVSTKLLKNAGAIDDDLPYYFYDFNVKATRDFANGDRLSPSAYLGRDILHISSGTADRISLNWGNTTYSLPYVHIFSPKLFSTNTVAGSFYESDYRFESSDNWFEFKNKIEDFTMKSDFSYFANARNTFDFGVIAKSLNMKLGIFSSDVTLQDDEFNGWNVATYLADDYRPTETVTITPGLRLEHNTLTESTDLLPRLAAKKQLNEHSNISAAWGMYTQNLQLVTFGDGGFQLFDSYVPIDKSLKTNTGQQYVLSYENDLEGPLKVSGGAYYKNFDRLIEFKANPRYDKDDNQLSDQFNSGVGYAYGWDVYLQGDWQTYQATLGYGIGRSYREFDAFDGGEKFPAKFDRLHNLNLFFSRKVSKRGQLEVRFNYGSSQPTTIAAGRYDQFGTGGQIFEPSKRNSYRLPDYQRLDIAYRLKYEYKGWSLSPYFEIINAYNHKNVLGRSYNMGYNPIKSEDIGQLPFLPSIGVNAEF